MIYLFVVVFMLGKLNECFQLSVFYADRIDVWLGVAGCLAVYLLVKGLMASRFFKFVESVLYYLSAGKLDSHKKHK